MGAITSLCSPGGGPCGGASPQHNNMNPKRVRITDRGGGSSQSLSDTSESPQNSQKKIIDVNEMVNTDTIRIIVEDEEDNADEDTELSSIYKLPTKTITIPRIIAKKILEKKQYSKIRKEMEKSAKKLDTIKSIKFNKNQCQWLIQGTDNDALEKHRSLFEIVIWRIPIIPAFAHFDQEKDLYKKINVTDDNNKNNDKNNNKETQTINLYVQ